MTGPWTARRGIDGVLAATVFLASLAWFHGTLPLTLELRDEGYLYFNIARTAAGEVPHRDFIDTYGPGVYAVTAPVFALSGGRILPVREWMAAIRAGAVACAYLIARSLVPRSFALFAAFLAAAIWGRSTYFINVPYAVFFTIPLGMASLVWWLRARRRAAPGALFAAGLLCGAGLLFKWTLAAASAYALALSLVAVAMLRAGGPPGPRWGRVALLAAWAAAGAAPVLPFLPILSPTEYLLHFAPIHGLLGVVALRFARHGDAGVAVRTALPGTLRFTAGVAIPPLLVAALYAHWGSLDVLVYDVVVRPMRYRNYHTALPLPPGPVSALGASVVAAAGSLLALLAARRRTALGLAAAAAAAAAVGAGAATEARGLLRGMDGLGTVLPALTSFAVLAWLARQLARPAPAPAAPDPGAVTAVLFFQMAMTFVIFPRGDNVTAMAGTLAPGLALLTHRAFLAAGGARGALPRRAAAFAAAALVPLLLVADGLRATWRQLPGRDLVRNALTPPALAGIRPKPKLYRSQHLAEFEQLVARLASRSFAGAPLLLMTNEPMVHVVSDNPPLLPEHAYVLFLAGWELLPESDPATPAQSELIAALARTPTALVLSREGDPTSAALAAAFPEVDRTVRERFELAARIGRYRLWRRRGTDP